MVGPRSSGCRRCVERRVRCDESRPRCSRCLRAGTECPGYRLPVQFFIPKTAKPKPEEDTIGSTKLDAASLHVERPERVFQPRPKPQQNPTRSAPASRGLGAQEAIQIQISPSVYDEDVYCILFLDKYFSFGAWDSDLQDNKQWIFDALQSPTKHPLSNLSLRALVTGFFGHFHRDKSLQRRASQMHCQALAMLAQNMGRTDSVDSFEILSCVALLLIHEFWCCTNHRGWVKHVQGLKTLIQLKGPSYFRQRPARSLLTMSRYALNVEALLCRRQNFLDGGEWRNILQSDNETYSIAFELTDATVQIPSLIEHVEQLERRSGNRHPSHDSTGLETLQALEMVLEDMNKWWERWSADHSRLPVRTRQKPTDLALQPLSPTFLRFPNLETAAIFCRYHALSIIVMKWTARLLRVMSTSNNVLTTDNTISLAISQSTLISSEHKPGTGHEIKAHAKAICEALSYYGLPQYVYVGAPYMCFPARVAWEVLQNNSIQEAKWIEDLLEAMAQRSGAAVARHTLCEIGERTLSCELDD